MTPLQHAAFKGQVPLCELMLANGADVNINEHENGYTTLMFGALSGEFSSTFFFKSIVLEIEIVQMTMLLQKQI